MYLIKKTHVIVDDSELVLETVKKFIIFEDNLLNYFCTEICIAKTTKNWIIIKKLKKSEFYYYSILRYLTSKLFQRCTQKEKPIHV